MDEREGDKTNSATNEKRANKKQKLRVKQIKIEKIKNTILVNQKRKKLRTEVQVWHYKSQFKGENEENWIIKKKREKEKILITIRQKCGIKIG